MLCSANTHSERLSFGLHEKEYVVLDVRIASEISLTKKAECCVRIFLKIRWKIYEFKQIGRYQT